MIVDYAHNAISMESLLKTLRDYHPKRLVCVFDVAETVLRTEDILWVRSAEDLWDLSILTAYNSRYEKAEDIIADIRGSISRGEDRRVSLWRSRPERGDPLQHCQCPARDMIAVIGKGHEDYQEINGVRYPFLDRQVIEEVVTELKIPEGVYNIHGTDVREDLLDATKGTLLCGKKIFRWNGSVLILKKRRWVICLCR